MYESFDTLCIYLESDALASPERNFWVKYRIAVVNQRHPDRTEWKDSAICTKTWNNSVLQFMKVCSSWSCSCAHRPQTWLCRSAPFDIGLCHIDMGIRNINNTPCPKCSARHVGSASLFGAQVSEIMDPEAGHVHRDGVVLACEVLECCPWFEFADLDVYGNTTEEEADDLSTDPDELLELGMHAVMISCLTQQCAPCCGCAAAHAMLCGLWI